MTSLRVALHACVEALSRGDEASAAVQALLRGSHGGDFAKRTGLTRYSARSRGVGLIERVERSLLSNRVKN